jgi:hypothetical protein
VWYSEDGDIDEIRPFVAGEPRLVERHWARANDRPYRVDDLIDKGGLSGRDVHRL